MRKNVFGRQLQRDTNERKALFRNLMSELVLHERIKTTEEKAKSIKASVEKLVTKAKKNGISAQAVLSPFLTTNAAHKIVTEIGPRFAKRPGGYTRIVRLENRFSDNASMVIMEWVEKGSQPKIKASTLKEKKVQPGAKDVDEVMADVLHGKEKKTPEKKKSKAVIKNPKKARGES